MARPIIFFDIAGPDMAAQVKFYQSVFGWSLQDGAGDMQVMGPLPGRLDGGLRGDPSDSMIYFGVEDITATLETIVAHGGAVVAPRFEAPGVVILGLFTDPAGNRMGLVEVEGERARVPEE